jgi:hypothetical protein
MKIPIFHNKGKEMNRFKCQVFVEKLPSYPTDSMLGLGYGIQCNFGNPNLMLDKQTNQWIPVVEGDTSHPRAFQQSIIQMGFSHNNTFALWNLNATATFDAGTVDYNAFILSEYTYRHLCGFGKGQFQCIEFENADGVMSVKIIDMVNGGIIYQAKEYPMRFNYDDFSGYLKVPLAPYTFCQIKIVGFANASHATFPAGSEFVVTMIPDTKMYMNVLDSEDDWETKMENMKVGGIQIPTNLLTAETSNLDSLVNKKAFNDMMDKMDEDKVPNISYLMKV